MKKLGLRPRRTVRVVLFTNEENGGRGGLAYRDAHRHELARHVMMLESDTGVFRPTGFGFSGTRARARDCQGHRLAARADRGQSDRVGGRRGRYRAQRTRARDSQPSLEVEGEYFVIHHTPADTVERIDPAHLAKCAAAVAVMTHVVADMPHRLGE